MITEFNVGPLSVKYMGESLAEAVTMSGGDPISATQHLAFITGPDGIALETAYLIFANGEKGSNKYGEDPKSTTSNF